MQVGMKERLIRLRQEQGLSQSGLAEALGVSRQAVSRWETGAAMPSAENLLCLSRLYGVPMDELIRGEEAEPEQKAEAPAGTQDAPKGDRALRRWRAAALVLAVLVCAGAYLVLSRNADPKVHPIDELEERQIDISAAGSFETTW